MAVLVLLPRLRSDDKRYIPGRTLVSEFECEEIGDLEGSAVAATGKYIVAEK